MNIAARIAIPPIIALVLVPLLQAKTHYRFEVFGAGALSKELTFEITRPQSTTPIRGAQSFSFGGRGGVRFGADGDGHFGQDLLYSYGTQASRISNRTSGGDFAFTSRVHQFSYNALWYPSGLGGRKKLFPYFTAGAGANFFNLAQRAKDEALDPARAGLGKMRNENVFAFNVGAGVRVRINSIYGFRFEVRDTMSRPARYGLPKTSPDAQAVVFPVGGIFHQVEFSIAFIYHFKEP